MVRLSERLYCVGVMASIAATKRALRPGSKRTVGEQASSLAGVRTLLFLAAPAVPTWEPGAGVGI